MHLSFIGMSNIGKTYWSQRLVAEAGFEHINCDDLIEKKLAGELVKQGYSGIHDVAAWMGQPYDAQYPVTSRQYLDFERDVMFEIIERLKSAPANKPLVVDTTGSVIYTGDNVTALLKKHTRIVHFGSSPKHVTKLFERYIANPKPVIWGDNYAPYDDETQADALRRCFPALLAYRSERYEALAHMSLPYEQHHVRNKSWTQMMGEK